LLTDVQINSVAPGNVDILTDLGIMYLKINEVDRAYEKLQEALSSDAKHKNCILAVGAIQQTRNDIDLALNTYKNMPTIQNEGFEIWSNIGLCFYRKNKLIAVILSMKMSNWV
jgi:Bardet-Biedl syndrome 4 protein